MYRYTVQAISAPRPRLWASPRISKLRTLQVSDTARHLLSPARFLAPVHGVEDVSP